MPRYGAAGLQIVDAQRVQVKRVPALAGGKELQVSPTFLFLLKLKYCPPASNYGIQRIFALVSFSCVRALIFYEDSLLLNILELPGIDANWAFCAQSLKERLSKLRSYRISA